LFILPGRISREKKTITAMMRIFCEEKHVAEKPLCSSCLELLEYAHLRLDRCHFGEKKTACADCPIHCYQPKQRQRIVEVMRMAGPRMIFRHPLMAFFHVLRLG
jgi:hypothetical protein